MADKLPLYTPINPKEIYTAKSIISQGDDFGDLNDYLQTLVKDS